MTELSTFKRLGLDHLPYNGPAICTQDDPTGKNHTPAFKPNGTPGRVYTQYLTADNRTPKERAESEARFRREMICQDGVLGAIACNRPFLELQSAEVSVQGGGYGTGGKTDGTWKGTEWNGVTVGQSKKPSARIGLCVKIKGAPRSQHRAQVNGALGYVYGSVDAANQAACIGAQFPPGADVGATIK